MAVSGILCAIIGLYPFKHSSFLIMLAFYWLVAAALIAFSYFLSTLFSKSRVAGTVAAVLYALAMIPGYVLEGYSSIYLLVCLLAGLPVCLPVCLSACLSGLVCW